MRQGIAAFGAGLLFAAGLVVGGMTQPSKVVGFLDFFGDWDPSLVLVMAGAIAVHAVLFRVVSRRKSPLLAEVFHVPSRRDLTLPLVLGSGLFGIGWGLGGFCPGPGLVSLVTGGQEALAFVASMGAGMLVYEAAQTLGRRAKRARGATDASATEQLAADALAPTANPIDAVSKG